MWTPPFFIQNRYMMGVGALAFILCVTYLTVWSFGTKEERKSTYAALDEQDKIVSRKRVSRWD